MLQTVKGSMSWNLSVPLNTGKVQKGEKGIPGEGQGTGASKITHENFP